MLARDVDICESIVCGRPVLISRLDMAALQRALRGAPVPKSDWLTVTVEHLDAIAEGGAFE